MNKQCTLALWLVGSKVDYWATADLIGIQTKFFVYVEPGRLYSYEEVLSQDLPNPLALRVLPLPSPSQL